MQGYLKIFQLFIKKEKMTFLQTLNQNYQTPQMIYHNVLLYITISLLVTTIFIIILLLKQVNKKIVEVNLLGCQHVTEMTDVKKEHFDTLERIRLEMLKREEEKSRQWIESEKETLHILGGVSTLLDLSDKFGRIESEKIMGMLEEIQENINKIIKAEET